MSTDGAVGARLTDILARQRAAFRREGAPDLEARQADLLRLKRAVLARRGAIEAAVRADFGHRPARETAIMELLPLVLAIDYQRRHLRRWLRPERRHVPWYFQPARAWVSYQPLGVIGIVSPWNYPLALALLPLATALAAGNRAMIKPSESTPASNAVLCQLVGEAFTEEQVAVITGDSAVGETFTALPFDHLLFTGSTAIGRAVMRAASEHLVPLTLELGGKSPAIIERGHPLAHAAHGIAYGKLANAGQTCIAPDYVLVHEEAIEPFVAAYDRAVRELYPDGPAGESYTAIIDGRRHARLLELLTDARARGAIVREVGPPASGAGRRAHTLAPSVVTGVDPSMRLMREEIFGPILPVIGYRDVEAAIACVNSEPRPLALYYFGAEGPDRRKVVAATTSGNVTINNTLLHYALEDLPFGGVGPSGMGAYHGVEGFRSLSHARGVFQQGRWNASALLRPPFGRVADLILKMLLR